MSQTAAAPSQAEIASRYTPKPPKAVKDQVDKIDQMYQPPAPPPGEVQPQAEPVPPGPDTPPAQPTPAAAAQPPAPPAQPSGPVDWEARARSSEGRMELLNTQNRQMAERMQSLEMLIATMQAQGTPPADPSQPAQPPAKPQLLTPEEVTEYGEEMLNVVAKRAREEFNPELDALRAQVTDLTNRLNGTVQLVTTQKSQTLMEMMDQQVPSWRQINDDPRFLSWLQAEDDWSGRTRHDVLKDVWARQDGKRVLKFFKAFAEAAGLPQSQQATAVATPPPVGQPAQPSLEELAAPGRARSAPQGQQLPPEKPIYSPADITKFMAEKMNGKWRGREAEAAAIEQDIFRAQHEGRIIVG